MLHISAAAGQRRCSLLLYHDLLLRYNFGSTGKWHFGTEQMGALGDRARAAEVMADKAEETAAVAMQRAGGAVRDEMEAAAVVKETQHALAKALQELRCLGPTEDEIAQGAAQCVLKCQPRQCTLAHLEGDGVAVQAACASSMRHEAARLSTRQAGRARPGQGCIRQ